MKYTIATDAVGTTWPFEEFVRMHGEYGAVVAANSKRGLIEYGVFGDADNIQIVTCVSNVVKRYSKEEFDNNKANLVVVVLESKMYCVCTKWEDVAIFEQVNKSWSLLEFAKTHGKMQVGEFKDKETGAIFKACIFTSPNDGTHTFVAFSTKLGELTPKEIAMQKDELYVVQLESGNYSLCKKRTYNRENVVWDDDEQSVSNEHEVNPTIDMLKEPRQSSKRDEKRVNWMNLNEIEKEAVAPYASLTTSTEIKKWPTSRSNVKIDRLPKETKPTSSHYHAVAIDMVIAIVAGISVYNSNMIHLEQDRMLFLVMCGVLAVVAWGYPYFDTSVKIDHDGCFAQGCIHPIIGVFGILFFPLFIHYWMYKGLKACIGLVKKNCN